MDQEARWKKLFRASETFRDFEEPADTRFRRLTRKFSSLPANEIRRPAAATAEAPVTTVKAPQSSTTTYPISSVNSTSIASKPHACCVKRSMPDKSTAM